MRNPERIPIILDKLKEIWTKQPDTRFCQLVSNLTYNCNINLFNIEDAELERLLEAAE